MSMENRLKKRFVHIGVAAIVILIFVIELGFYLISHHQLERTLDLTLTYIIDHDESGDIPSVTPESSGESFLTETAGAGQNADGTGEETEATVYISGVSKKDQVQVSPETSGGENLLLKLISGFRDFGDSISGNVEITPEGKYRMRYFLITIDQDGKITDTSLSHIAEISQESAEKLALEHYQFEHEKGILAFQNSKYFYKTVQEEDGSAVVGFLECTQEVQSVQAMRRITVFVALIIVVLYVIILICLSKKAIAPFVENMESQKEFITNASHEMKTPLAIISANTEVIEMMDGKSEWTDSIREQVSRSTGLINSMLALCRMNETQKIELAAVDFSEIVLSSEKSFLPVAEQAKKKLEAEIQEGIMVMGDRNLLTELSNILIDNAVKYCDDGGSIQVSLKRKGRSGVVFTVANDYKEGAGVDTGMFFRRFYRGDTSHNSQKAGNGIGLSMARSIAEKMGGGIDANWKDGEITFRVNLEIAKKSV